MSVHLTLIHLNDVFHSFQTIMNSEGLGGSSMLEGEGEGVHEWEYNIILLFFINHSKSIMNQVIETCE